MSFPRVQVFDGADYPARAATVLADAIRNAVAARERCALALAGGATPLPVYRALAAMPAGDVPWAKVHVFFGDERAVPRDHPDSNYRAAREALLQHVPIPQAQVHPMEADRPDRQAAAAAYARLLPGGLDVLILGMGGDGHTASLFPGSPALAETTQRVVPVTGPKPPPSRLTITPPVIREAQEVFVLVTGADKADMVARALGTAAPGEVPAALARHGTWLLDRAAAARLDASGG